MRKEKKEAEMREQVVVEIKKLGTYEVFEDEEEVQDMVAVPGERMLWCVMVRDEVAGA